MNVDVISLDYLEKQISTKIISSFARNLLDQIMQVLQTDIIDIQKLKQLCSKGIPDDIRGLRSLCWKLIIGYLPKTKADWHKKIEQNQKNYKQYCHDFLNFKLNEQQEHQLQIAEMDIKMNREQLASIQKIIIFSDQFNEHHEKECKSFFEDQDIWEMIQKDTTRTRAEYSFFQQEIGHQKKNEFPVYFINQISRERKSRQDYEHRHYDVLTRILFIYAKFNPAIKYIQGMNELLAPIYYTYYTDESPEFLSTVESDAFFSFTMFMAEAKDNFIRSMDETPLGIMKKMGILNEALKKIDFLLWKNLVDLQIHPQFYSLRWILLYLTQEFQLIDVLRIWDSLLSSEKKNEYLIYLCLAILQLIKKKVNDHQQFFQSDLSQRFWQRDGKFLEYLRIRNTKDYLDGKLILQ